MTSAMDSQPDLSFFREEGFAYNKKKRRKPDKSVSVLSASYPLYQSAAFHVLYNILNEKENDQEDILDRPTNSGARNIRINVLSVEIQKGARNAVSVPCLDEVSQKC